MSRFISSLPAPIRPLRGPWGWTLFALIWTLAMMAVVFKLFYTGRFKRISTFLYIAMGWIIVIAIGPMVQLLSATTLAWFVAGGVSYTAGTFFYLNKRIPCTHAIWHLFVLGASVCHGIAMTTH